MGVTIRDESAEPDEGETVSPERAVALRLALLGAVCLATLALVHLLLHWVLLTDALLRWILYY